MSPELEEQVLKTRICLVRFLYVAWARKQKLSPLWEVVIGDDPYRRINDDSSLPYYLLHYCLEGSKIGEECWKHLLFCYPPLGDHLHNVAIAQTTPSQLRTFIMKKLHLPNKCRGNYTRHLE